MDRTGKLVYQFDLGPDLSVDGLVFVPHLYTWSPDGRFLAFSLSSDNHNKFIGLGILDLQTKGITIVCLPGKRINFEISNIIWSPDDRAIIIEMWEGDTNEVLLLNLQDKTAVQIAQDADVGGWMVEPTH